MTEWYGFVEDRGAIELDDRGLQYGDGLFETVAIRHGMPRLWNYHARRLESGCERLALKPPSSTSLQQRLVQAVAGDQQHGESCIAKVVVTAGVMDRGYGRPTQADPSIYIGLFPANPVSRTAYEQGVSTILCETRLAVGSPVAGLKTLNRIEQVLARSECIGAGVFEGFTLDTEGRVICGTMSNVFIARNKTITTPALDRCGVAGTMRQFILDLLEQQGTEVRVSDMVWSDVVAADEVFITNSQIGVVPVRSSGQQEWTVGSATRDVMKLLADNGIAECRL